MNINRPKRAVNRTRVLLCTAAMLGLVTALTTNAQNADQIDFVANELVFDANAGIVELFDQIEIKTSEGYFYTDYVSYDRNNDIILVDGHLRAVLADGTIVIAQYAELDRETQNLIAGDARALLVNRMQLASVYYDRTPDYQYGEGVVASSCSVCTLKPTPIWQVRAEQLYLDEASQKLYVKNGKLDFFGLPIIYLPRWRFPGPDAGRQEGFLTPSLTISDQSGTGVSVPYYWVLSDYADLKLTTRMTLSQLAVSDFRYRQNIPNGQLVIDGGVLLREEEGATPADNVSRYFVELDFDYALPYDFDLTAQYTAASDYSVQSEYNFGRFSKDGIYVDRYRNNDLLTFELSRERPSSEADALRNQQSLAPYLRYARGFDFGQGWQFDLEASYLGLQQSEAIDVQQITTGGVLSRTDIFGPGLIGTFELGLSARASWYSDLSSIDDPDTAAMWRPEFSYDVAWPLSKTDALGVHRLTPRVGIASTQDFGYDDLNNPPRRYLGRDDFVGLYSTDFPDYGQTVENRTEIQLGVDYYLDFANAGTLELAIGRAIAFDHDEVSRDGQFSEWVGYANYEHDYWSINNRFSLDTNFDLTRFESGFAYTKPNFSLRADWLQLVADPALGVVSPVNELDIAGSLRIKENIQIGYGLYYDLENQAPFDATLSLLYGNECIEAEIGATWDFDKGEGIEAERSMFFRVDLLGLTKETNTKWGRRTCI